MKEVKTQKRYKCDFCQKRSIKRVIALHEPRCFRNPNRFCDYCKNKGFTEEDYGVEGASAVKTPCTYCSRFDPKQLKEIEAREANLTPPSEGKEL